MGAAESEGMTSSTGRLDGAFGVMVASRVGGGLTLLLGAEGTLMVGAEGAFELRVVPVGALTLGSVELEEMGRLAGLLASGLVGALTPGAAGALA